MKPPQAAIVLEQVDVGVEREAGRVVTEPALHLHDIPPLREQARRCLGLSRPSRVRTGPAAPPARRTSRRDTATTWEGHAADLDHHESELRNIERSLRVQALRLEEQEDPKHPVIVLATKRIEELSARKSAITAALEALKTKRPAGHHPDESQRCSTPCPTYEKP